MLSFLIYFFWMTLIIILVKEGQYILQYFGGEGKGI